MKRFLLIVLVLCLLAVNASAEILDDISREYTFTLEGETYTLPCPLENFYANGFSSTSPGGLTDVRTLEPHTYSVGSIYLDEAKLSITVSNLTGQSLPVAECMVIGITVTEGDDFAPVLANGITLGASAAEVVAAYGEDIDRLAGKKVLWLSFGKEKDTNVGKAAAGENTLGLQLDKPFDDPEARLVRLSLERFPE